MQLFAVVLIRKAGDIKIESTHALLVEAQQECAALRQLFPWNVYQVKMQIGQRFA